MELRRPQAKRKQTAVIRLERDRLIAELPIPLCSSRVGQVICQREKLVQRIKQQQGVKISAQLEQGLHRVLEAVEDYTDKTRLAYFSITLPYVPLTPYDKRLEAALELKAALIDDFELRVEGSDTMVKYAVAAAA